MGGGGETEDGTIYTYIYIYIISNFWTNPPVTVQMVCVYVFPSFGVHWKTASYVRLATSMWVPSTSASTATVRNAFFWRRRNGCVVFLVAAAVGWSLFGGKARFFEVFGRQTQRFNNRILALKKYGRLCHVLRSFPVGCLKDNVCISFGMANCQLFQFSLTPCVSLETAWWTYLVNV